MAYVVPDKCIMCKYTDCVDVCPVDCFCEGENTLVINPDECIDCGVCAAECPISAIVMDSDPEGQEFAEMNRQYSDGRWPGITRKKPAMPEAEKYKNEKNKINLLSEKPGKGD